MDDAVRNIAIIPARGGSQRLPRKNVLPLAGKPLIAWTIEAALACDSLTDIVVSSDDVEILAIADAYGVIVHHRDQALATATAATRDVMLNVLDWRQREGANYRTCVLLQPTSPLRTADDIESALALFDAGGGDTVISVSQLDVPLEWCGTLGHEGALEGFDALMGNVAPVSTAYRLNGAIYIFDCKRFRRDRRYQTKRNLGFVMPVERAVDIDTERDLLACEAYLSDQASFKANSSGQQQ